MPSLTSLPPELRQQILLHCFPHTNTLPSIPPSIHTLLLVSRQFHSDTAAILPSWSPIHTLSSTAHISALLPPQAHMLHSIRCAPKLEHVCISLWHASSYSKIFWTCYCRGPEYWSHPELIEAWKASVPKLPTSGIKRVDIDVTPAPGWMRTKHRLALRANVWDRCAAVKFLECHRQDVDALIAAIDAHYGGTVRLRFTGTLARRSAFFVQGRYTNAGERIEFEGQWVEREQARVHKINTVVERFVVAGKEERRRFVKLHDVPWQKDTKWAYAVAVDEGWGDDVAVDVQRLAEFWLDGEGEKWEMRPACNVRRKVIHKMARDLGFVSTSVGEGEGRYVVVRRKGEDDGIDVADARTPEQPLIGHSLGVYNRADG